MGAVTFDRELLKKHAAYVFQHGKRMRRLLDEEEDRHLTNPRRFDRRSESRSESQDGEE